LAVFVGMAHPSISAHIIFNKHFCTTPLGAQPTSQEKPGWQV
jgi:hypothetical protein